MTRFEGFGVEVEQWLRGLEVWGMTLATAPRGYGIDHPRIELLRRKNLTVGARRRFGEGIDRATGLRFVKRTWRAAAPVTGWLDEHVGPTSLLVDRQRRRPSQRRA